MVTVVVVVVVIMVVHGQGEDAYNHENVCFFFNETKISGTLHDIPVQERDQMAPDAVQYARALRPPYHLLSFLR